MTASTVIPLHLLDWICVSLPYLVWIWFWKASTKRKMCKTRIFKLVYCVLLQCGWIEAIWYHISGTLCFMIASSHTQFYHPIKYHNFVHLHITKYTHSLPILIRFFFCSLSLSRSFFFFDLLCYKTKRKMNVDMNVIERMKA